MLCGMLPSLTRMVGTRWADHTPTKPSTVLIKPGWRLEPWHLRPMGEGGGGGDKEEREMKHKMEKIQFFLLKSSMPVMGHSESSLLASGVGPK